MGEHWPLCVLFLLVGCCEETTEGCWGSSAWCSGGRWCLLWAVGPAAVLLPLRPVCAWWASQGLCGLSVGAGVGSQWS